MAGSLNKVMLIGNVGKDPEIRNTQGGQKIANITLATSEDWTDKASGERKSKTEWHRVSVFNDKIAEVVERFVKKGSKIFVEGQIATREWTDKDGQKRFSTEINIGRFNGALTLLDGKASGGDTQPERQPTRQPAANSYNPPNGGGGSDLAADEIPF